MRIGIYPRKSVYRDNSESVATQVKLCKEYANIIYASENIEFHIYSKDEGFSGKNTKRPSYQELMEDVCNDKLDVVMVYQLDRISRNVTEFSAMFSILQQHNVSFLSLKETFDTNTPIGRTVMYILAAFAQLERENISSRVSDNMQALGASGKWTGGKLPAGMKSFRQENGGKIHSYLMVDEDNIWRVKQLYELLLSGYSITGIERYCRDNNITSQNGKFLSTSQIYNIITNPVYCQADLSAFFYFSELGCRITDKQEYFDGSKGLMVYGRTNQGGAGPRKANYSEWNISIGVHDYVISADQWLAAQKRLGVNKQDRSNKYQVGILKGVLRCKCGARMANRVYVKKGRLFGYYYCESAFRKNEHVVRYYRIEEIDDLFIETLKETRLNPEFIKLQELPEEHTDPAALQADIRITEAAINNLTTQLQENVASSAAKYIIAQIEALDRKLAALRSQLHRSELKRKKDYDNSRQQKAIYDNICLLLDGFDNMGYIEKNELVKRITRKCVLDGDKLEITF